MADILLIEDDEILLQAQTRFLQNEGFTVHACEDGKRALECLGKNVYDLVITDLNMPHASGFEVMTAIRSQERHKDTPVIVMTSMSDRPVMNYCFRLGASDFIAKPVMPSELRVRIKKLLRSFA